MGLRVASSNPPECRLGRRLEYLGIPFGNSHCSECNPPRGCNPRPSPAARSLGTGSATADRTTRHSMKSSDGSPETTVKGCYEKANKRQKRIHNSNIDVKYDHEYRH